MESEDFFESSQSSKTSRPSTPKGSIVRGPTGLCRDGSRSAFTPYRPSTVLTNLQRGNVQTQSPAVMPERSIHQLAAQGELTTATLDDENVKDDQGMTPLIWASSYGQLPTVQLLLRASADVNAVAKDGQTALLLAAANGHSHVVTELLRHGAPPNHCDMEGNSALMYAAYNNHAICAHELLNAGANVSHENNFQDTAYEVSVTRGSKKVQAVLEKHLLGLLLKG